jgi:hypothetical protein
VFFWIINKTARWHLSLVRASEFIGASDPNSVAAPERDSAGGAIDYGRRGDPLVDPTITSDIF